MHLLPPSTVHPGRPQVAAEDGGGEGEAGSGGEGSDGGDHPRATLPYEHDQRHLGRPCGDGGSRKRQLQIRPSGKS